MDDNSHKLISLLHTIIENVEQNKYTSNDIDLLYKDINEIITPKNKNIDPLTIKYLIRGWILSLYIDESLNDNNSSANNNEKLKENKNLINKISDFIR